MRLCVDKLMRLCVYALTLSAFRITHFIFPCQLVSLLTYILANWLTG